MTLQEWYAIGQAQRRAAAPGKIPRAAVFSGIEMEEPYTPRTFATYDPNVQAVPTTATANMGGRLLGNATPGDYVYGDSYGQVQGAEQNVVNESNQFYLNLLAAQRAAQQLAMQEAEVRRRDALSRAQLGQTAKQLGLYEKAGADKTTLDKALLEFNKSQITSQKADTSNAILNFGKSAAQAFQPIRQAVQEDVAAVNTLLQDQAAIRSRADAMQGSGKLVWDKSTGIYKASEETYTPVAATLNESLRNNMAALTQAQNLFKEHQTELAAMQKEIMSKGFFYNPQSNLLVHGETGKTFSNAPQQVPAGPALAPPARPAAAGGFAPPVQAQPAVYATMTEPQRIATLERARSTVRTRPDLREGVASQLWRAGFPIEALNSL